MTARAWKIIICPNFSARRQYLKAVRGMENYHLSKISCSETASNDGQGMENHHMTKISCPETVSNDSPGHGKSSFVPNFLPGDGI